jgi:hypothetical protein
MVKNAANYISALVILLATSVIYQIGTEAWLRPPKVQTVRPREDMRADPDESLADLFPDNAWQRGVCKRLRTDDGVLLFKRWEQTSGDHWKLWPITLVVGRGMSGDLDPEPVIVEAAEGAEIEFAESLDVMSGGAPPIKRGRLIGKVEIRRPAKAAKRPSLSIQTSNVGINNRKLWTTETIRMNFGQATMVGRDLTLFLAVSAGSVPDGVGAAAVLDRMELTYLDQLIMPLEEGGLWKSGTKTKAKSPAKPIRLPDTQQHTKVPAMVSVRCGGRVDYDFAVDQLSLRDAISLIHQTPAGVVDRFDCEAIDLNLRNPTDQSLARKTPLDWISRVSATGTPAVMKMPSFDFVLKAERIDLDAINGLIRADGRKGVEVQRGPFWGRLTQLAYQFDPRRPKSIGAIDAFGAGLVKISDSELMVKEIRWREGFKLQPSETTDFERLNSNLQFWIDGAVETKFADGGKFNANAIEGILKPVENPKPKAAPAKFAPDRLQATGAVVVDTDAIKTETEILRLYFVENTDPPPESVQPDASASPGMFRQWVVQPGNKQGKVDPVARPRPTIRGDLVSAQLTLTDQGADTKDLSVVGAVELNHVVSASGKTLPVKLTGEEFRLNVEGGREVLKLGSGTEAPARFEIGDGFFVGPMILIWPNENFVQIQGAGEFQMPMAVLPTALMAEDPNRIRWIKAPHCKWNGELRFDGKKAVLTDGVDIRAALLDRNEPWGLHMMGERMDIVLLEDIKVSEIQSLRRAAIQQITLTQSADNPVIVNAERRAPDGVLEGRHVLHAPRLTLMPSGGGKLTGSGPGWYRAWMYAPKDGLLATQEENENAETQLTGMHLTYHDGLEGDMKNKSLAFFGGVRVGLRAIQTWKDVFDAKEMNEISTGESTLDCDRLTVAVAPGFEDGSRSIPGVPTPWEMEAHSGIVFRTRNEKGLFEVTAARAAYSSGKGLFVMEGAPNRGAIIQHTKPNGDTGPRVNAIEIAIRPKPFKIEHSLIRGFTVGTLPGTETR